MTCREILKRLKSLSNPKAVEGMTRFGIKPKNAYGISMPVLRKIAKEIGKSHALAQRLWSSSNHEARILACMIDEPERVSEQQMEKWARDFDSWAVCDGACLHLFRYTPFAQKKCFEWSSRREEFVKRAAFALIAWLAAGDRNIADKTFLEFLPLIKRESVDQRNFVRKAVNWALRQVGKRNARLNKAAMKTGREIQKVDSPGSRWIASNALRELGSKAVQRRLQS